MNPIALESPVLEDGIPSVNFFNGRLLTANDLRREQNARHLADWRLGQAVGDGVAYGLQVSKHRDSTIQNPLVTVEAGLAVNRSGQALKLENAATISLVRKSKLSTNEPGTFGQCGNLETGTYVAGPGIYLLTIAPATASKGKVPTSGLETFGGKCNTDAVFESVQFRLIALESVLTGIDLSNEDKLRNIVAYRCFGIEQFEAFARDPFGTQTKSRGLLGDLPTTVLTDCDVPLAVLYWTLTGGVRFIDNWSVRRRVCSPSDAFGWGIFVNDRHRAEGEATFLQFQEHVSSLRTSDGDLGSVTATSHFPTLPPVGAIPVKLESNKTDAEATKFFAGMTYRGPVFINAARLETLIRQSIAYPPIDISSGEMIWLYRVRENAVASDFAAGKKPQRYIVFASGHIPYLGDAQFDLAYWNYSNYALAL